MMHLEDIRREYLMGGLSEESMVGDPQVQFELWMQQAMGSGIPDPTAMTLASVDSDGQASQRIVLLKHLDERGFVFFTNYNSAKSRDLLVNPKVSLHFPWHAMERQVKIIGVAHKVSEQESAEYFSSRPRDSQIAAWASPQSNSIVSREFLLEQVARYTEKFSGSSVPLPEFWGGFRIVPNIYEFWQGGAGRLHDRFEYRLSDQSLWCSRRLAP